MYTDPASMPTTPSHSCETEDAIDTEKTGRTGIRERIYDAESFYVQFLYFSGTRVELIGCVDVIRNKDIISPTQQCFDIHVQ